jgi:riboflavin synthase
LRDQLNKAKRSAKSVQGIEDWVTAANKMLEEYGAEHIKLPITPGTLKLIEQNAIKEQQPNEE